MCSQKQGTLYNSITYITQNPKYILEFRLWDMKLNYCMINSCNLQFVNSCILGVSNNFTFCVPLFLYTYLRYIYISNAI